jgi:16S rRNA processing protein RimM
LVVGRVARPHGVRGDVVVDLLTDRAERTTAGAALVLVDGRELTVERATTHGTWTGGTRWIVHFAGVDGRDAAAALAGSDLLAPPLDDPDELWVHDLVGSEVVDVGGTRRGRVVAVVDNPAHDLLELDSGALVPVVFVRSCRDGVTTVEPPEGLFDLG